MNRFAIALLLSLSPLLIAGCGISFNGDDIADLLADAISFLQTRPQQLPPVLVDQGDTILISASATIIINPSEEIVLEELPNLTVLGFENDTGWDIYIKYYADGELQGIYVYHGEALLIEYPCLDVVELFSEDDIDPETGALVDSFDLTGTDFFNPDDFYCGDALILNFDPFTVSAHADVIDLSP